MKKIDITVLTEVIGIALFATGVAMISIPLALIAVGAFLVWVTEK
jgi:biopolymer transport protein ExbB/TolQ